MVSRIDPSIAGVILLVIGFYTISCSADPPAYAAVLVKCTIPTRPCLCKADDEYCATTMEPGTLRRAAAAGEEPEYEAGIPTAKLSLYKTISYVTGATITDQLWYLAIASAAATTGGIFFAVNAATSSAMTYGYEYLWAFCCEAPPGLDGVVPVSATKAVIYRGLSVIRVGALALVFGNTMASATVVTGAITLSRTAVYVTNDYIWNRIDVRERTDPVPVEIDPPGPLVSVQPGSVD